MQLCHNKNAYYHHQVFQYREATYVSFIAVLLFSECFYRKPILGVSAVASTHPTAGERSCQPPDVTITLPVFLQVLVLLLVL